MTRDRQIAPRTLGPGANFQHGALIQFKHQRRRQRPAVEAEREFAAGYGNMERRGFGSDFDATHGNFQRGRTWEIADGQIGRGMRQRIHRPRGSDAKAKIAVTAGILQRHPGPS